LVAGQRLTGWVRRVTTPTNLAGVSRRVFPGYIVLLLIVHLMPFDFTVSIDELAVKYQEGKIWLVPFQHFVDGGLLTMLLKTCTNMAAFFPLGFLKAFSCERRKAHLPTMLFVLALGVPMLVEFLQLLVYSRVCDITDILTGGAAVLMGWTSADLLQANRRSAGATGWQLSATEDSRWRRRSLLAGLMLAWFGVVLYLNWSPFDFTTDPARFPDGPDELSVWGLRHMSWLPLVDYYWGSKYQALDQFVRKSVSFIPLGILCALASARVFRPRSGSLVLSLALSVALVIETGRYLIPSHSASVTDLLLQCAGAWIGFKGAQYFRALLWAENALFGYLSPAGGLEETFRHGLRERVHPLGNL
jgi:glycopeptide antibiotics resistance protein